MEAVNEASFILNAPEIHTNWASLITGILERGIVVEPVGAASYRIRLAEPEQAVEGTDEPQVTSW